MSRIMLFTALLSAVVLVTLTVFASAAKPGTANKTLVNLQAAYNGESNAHARYTEFATKADKDGYKGVASLFRAAAHAEKVHSERMAEVIKKLGATPEAKIETPKVGTTKENLEAAIKGETEERDKIYPEAITQAKADKEPGAAVAFEYAKAAEGEHAALYTKALDKMNEWKEEREFQVCPKCGKTVEKAEFKNCPTCATPTAKFAKIK